MSEESLESQMKRAVWQNHWWIALAIALFVFYSESLYTIETGDVGMEDGAKQ